MIDVYSDEFFMKKALNEAQNAFEKNEVPVGALIVCQNQIIAKAYNQTEQLSDVTAHAEILAITAASEFLGAKYLKECTLYVTLEPCVMCAGALAWSQIGNIVYGANDEKRGAGRYEKIYHPKTIVKGGILESECAEIIKNFFKDKR